MVINGNTGNFNCYPTTKTALKLKYQNTAGNLTSPQEQQQFSSIVELQVPISIPLYPEEEQQQ